MKIVLDEMEEDTAEIKESKNEFGGEHIGFIFNDANIEFEVKFSQDDAFVFYKKLKDILSKYYEI